jgi:hypothetical protein
MGYKAYKKIISGSALLIMLAAIVSCEAKQPVTEFSRKETPSLSASKMNTGIIKHGHEQSPSSVKNPGGDQLPTVVDPNSPGSCALVAKGEICGDCCSDVFNEDSARWYQCMDACSKAEANSREH